MYVVLLKVADKAAAAAHLEGHKDWLRRGFEDGAFLLVGSLPEGAGGAVLAHGAPREEIERRVAEDPFVAEKVATAEILEIAPAKADPRLAFLVP